MKRSIVVLLHASYWLMYGLLITFLYFLSQATATEELEFALDEDLVFTLLSTLLAGMISFYGFYFFLVPRLLAKRNIGRFLLGGAFISVISGSMPTILLSLTLYQLMPVIPEARIQLLLLLGPMLLAGFTFLAAVNGAISTVMKGFITWYGDIRVKEALEKKNLAMQLDLLKAKLNPHFLFNTLNNIDILILKDGPTASRYLNQLSDLLRFMLYESPQERVPLSRELHYIELYLQLQKIRTTNEQFVEYSINGTAGPLSIAPMLFAPFIENAFKYATNKKIQKAISIQFHLNQTEIGFTCRNVVDSQQTRKQTSGGLGLKLIRQRLEMLYKDRHTLHIDQTPDTFLVELRLQLQESEPATSIPNQPTH